MWEIKRKDNHLLFRGDRIVNFRPVLLMALAFAAGVLLAYCLGAASLYFTAVWLAAVAAASVLKHYKKRAVFGFLLFTALLCVLFALGSVSFLSCVGSFDASPELEGTYTLRGRITEVSAATQGQTLSVGDLTATDANGQSVALRYRCSVRTFGETEFSEGDIICFTAKVETVDAVRYGRLSATSLLSKTRYRAYVSASAVAVEGHSFDLFGTVRGRLRTVLFDNMDETVAPVAYAALTGDSGYIDSGLLQNFRYGGVAHVFAVSGLHIGIVCAALSFVLRKLRLRRCIRLPVLATVLIFYAGVCGFSASSVRALIMCLVLLCLEAAGIQYDRLTSVSAAALCILLLNPAQLFAVGFQLSVAAAAGIVLLGPHMKRLLSRLRFLPRKMTDALTVSLSAQIFTFPVLLDCFGYVSGIGIFLNILFVPLFGAVYVVLFGCSFAACFLSFAGTVLLYVPSFLLRLVVTPVSAIEFGALLICGFSFGGGCTALWYAGAFVASDKINLKAVPKAILLCVLAAVFLAFMLLRNVSPSARLTLHAYYGTDVAILHAGGETCVILSGDPSESYLERLFLQEGIAQADVAIILAEDDEINAAVPVLLRCTEVGVLYVGGDSELPDTFHTVDIEVQSGFFTLCGYSAAFVGETALYLEAEGAAMLICMQTPQTDIPHCDLLICAEEDETLSAAAQAEAEICFEKSAGKISIYQSGELQITWKDDIITIRNYR